MTGPAAEFSRIVPLGSLPARGRAMEISASPTECQALARRFDIPAIESLSAALQITPLADGRVRVTGTLTARVVQVCVVALEPFAHGVEAPVAVIFVPRADFADDAEGAIDPDTADEEPYDGERFDVGEAVAQTLSLALDPWPRNPESKLPPGGTGDADQPPAQNPFAALAKRRR